ncbi:MAG: fimbrial biogenesis chaperone [Xanthobacteraceae bacterium]
MSTLRVTTLTTLVALLMLPSAAKAASLQVVPVVVEITAPGATASLTLKNEGDRPLNGQVRVFRWTQVNGEDKLEPTNDVVASPPIVTIRGKSSNLVRIVRTSKAPVEAEETYRLLIDELPTPVTDRPATVNIVLRYSIPVFFTVPSATAPKLKWELQKRNNKPVIVASNSGERYARISKLKVTDGKGAVVNFGEGLAGYVLGQSAHDFAVPDRVKGFGNGGLGSVSAQSNAGAINVKP